jgi:hypothetical protein
VIPGYCFRKLIILDEVRSQLGANYTNAMAPVTPQQLASALNVRQIIVPRGYYNSAKQGQTDTLAQIWGKHAWAAYIPAQPKKKERCFGYTVRRKSGPVVDRWYDNDRKGWWIRNSDEWDQYIIDETAVYMIKDACA